MVDENVTTSTEQENVETPMETGDVSPSVAKPTDSNKLNGEVPKETLPDVNGNVAENGTADNDIDDDLEVERILDKIEYEDGKVMIAFSPLISGKLFTLQ